MALEIKQSGKCADFGIIPWDTVIIGIRHVCVGKPLRDCVIVSRNQASNVQLGTRLSSVALRAISATTFLLLYLRNDITGSQLLCPRSQLQLRAAQDTRTSFSSRREASRLSRRH